MKKRQLILILAFFMGILALVFIERFSTNEGYQRVESLNDLEIKHQAHRAQKPTAPTL